MTTAAADSTAETAPPTTVEGSGSASRPVGMVVVMSAKGGCGGTLIAANLAASLAPDCRVCLVDLDLCKGDIAGALDLHSDRSINLLLDRMDKLDDALLAGSVDEHACGMHVLQQPYDLTDLHQVSPDEVRTLLSFLADNYDLVVVDVGSRMDLVTMTAAQVADELLLVVTADVPSLRDAQRVLGLLRHLDVPPARVRLVLNKHQDGAGVAPDDIITQLHVPIAAILPADADASDRADTRGRLLSEVAPHAKLTRSLADLWPTLRGDHPNHPHRISWPWSRRA